MECLITNLSAIIISDFNIKLTNPLFQGDRTILKEFIKDFLEKFSIQILNQRKVDNSIKNYLLMQLDSDQITSQDPDDQYE